MPAVYGIHILSNLAGAAPLELPLLHKVYIITIFLWYLIDDPWIRPLEDMVPPLLPLYYGLRAPLLEYLLLPRQYSFLPSSVVPDIIIEVQAAVAVARHQS